jgi:hypothetical protein
MPVWLLAIAIVALVGLRLGVDPLAAEAIAFVLAGLAAWSFTAGDPPRRPWALRALAIGLVLVAHAIQRLGGAIEGVYALLVVANLIGAAAIVGFVQVVRGSGLTVTLTRLRTAVVIGVGVAAASVVGLVIGQVAPQADAHALVIAVSTLCDAVVFVGAALLLRLMVPLRGGVVAQPYSLLALDGVFYLIADLGHAAASPGLVAALPVLGAVGGAGGATAALAQVALLRRG